MMNDNPTPNTENNEEFENFERLAKKLFSLPQQDIDKLKKKEKELGISQSEEDTEAEESNQSN